MCRAASCLLLCLAIATPVFAQQSEPIGRFAVDLRGIFARHKKEPTVAEGLGVDAANLPLRSIGLTAGAHVYPFRAGKITFGFGGEVAVARGSKALDILGSDGKSTTKGPAVQRHFQTFAPEVSLNFGHRRGWSYISGGMFGRSKLYAEGEEKPATPAPMRKTVNYGGGARWFFKSHLAFSVDVRWYSIAEGPTASDAVPRIVQPKTTLLVLSGGISIK
jgi:hypothetical protein